jgi:hypothetical protein
MGWAEVARWEERRERVHGRGRGRVIKKVGSAAIGWYRI